MEELIRETRRSHRERLLARARKWARRSLRFHSDPKEEEVDRLAFRYLSAPKMCSCSMCGNRRRTAKGKERLTLKERVVCSSGEE